MNTGNWARRRAAECAALALKVSPRSRNALVEVARNWMVLANQLDRLARQEALVKEKAVFVPTARLPRKRRGAVTAMQTSP